MRRRALHVEVLLDGDLFLHRAITPGRPLLVGDARGCDIPTTALRGSLPLLEAFPDGYGLHLAPPLDGRIRVGGRWLRICEGLLCDPRPEPLRLVEGDGGEIRLGTNLRLRFSVVPARPAFAAGLELDPRLAASVGGVLVVAGLLAALTLRLAPPAREPGREVKLQVRPARLLPFSSSPEPRRPAARRGTTVRPAAPRLLAARREASRRRGLLGLLDPGLERPGSRRLDPLAAMDRLLAATAPLGARRSGADRAPAAWLGGSGSGLGLDDGPGAHPRATLPAAPGLPRESLAQPGPDGPSREAIREVVARGSAGVRICYERELLSATEAREGRLVLRWTIDGGGRAVNVTVKKDTVQLPGLTECVVRQVRAWRFPPCGDGRCAVVYPFEFFTRS